MRTLESRPANVEDSSRGQGLLPKKNVQIARGCQWGISTTEEYKGGKNRLREKKKGPSEISISQAFHSVGMDSLP